MYTMKWHSWLSEIDREQWNALADQVNTPLLEWEWLNRMEESGSMTPDTGWYPRHLTVWQGDELVAAAPLYIKTHSMGEFVFDFAWADVARQIGASYYPKMVGTVPATPAVAYRFLIDDELDTAEMTEQMVTEIHRYCRENDIHGTSFLFVDPEFKPYLEELDFIGWYHQNFMWTNPGYESFDEYLADFSKNQRRNIRRERRAMDDQDVTFRALTGEAIPDEYLDLMYDYYVNTNAQFGPFAAKFLNRSFFTGLRHDYKHRILLCCAYVPEEDDPIAMSFLVYKRDQMVGRYWGADRFIDSLHFNACYYFPIQWAIEQGIRHFDPGMGSSHKVRRGFHATGNYSMHHFYDPRMHMIMKENISKINHYEQHNIDYLNEHLPFAKRPTKA
jgi:hypothetical protein